MIILTIIILWALLGIAGNWRMYHGQLKMWYNRFNESYWDYDKRNGNSAIRTTSSLFILSPIFGLIYFLLSYADKDCCWWFTTKGKI